MSHAIIPADANGGILVCDEGLSVWGGVNAKTGVIQDAQHPQHGQGLAGRIVLMPTSRGSCSGGGVLMSLLMAGRGPAALVFREAEEILTLGAVVARRMFGLDLAVLRLDPADYDALAAQLRAEIRRDRIIADGVTLPLRANAAPPLALSAADEAMLSGAHGLALQLAMEIMTDMARAQGAERLIDVSRAHIDGCHYAGPAFLSFAERMAGLGARTRIPTTMNAISVDHANWRAQGVDPAFGEPAARVADVYVAMGVQPCFTCAPYHLADRPGPGEDIGWSESNAVIFANSVLGARSAKHSDFLDLCMAMTGRAPQSGVYLEDGRRARRIVDAAYPDGADDAYWPLLGWLLGKASPDRIPLVRGLEQAAPTEDDLRALCAAFGTTSAAPMLHVAGATPEADLPPAPDADHVAISTADFSNAWRGFNPGGGRIELVAIGSPHAAADECRAFLSFLNNRKCNEEVSVIITLGRSVGDNIAKDGTADALKRLGVKLVSDVCWCLISEPVFPPSARVVITNSGKYAHYGPGLSGRQVRFGGLAACAEAAVTGFANSAAPGWM